MTTGVRELRLWQEAVALGGEVARLMRQSCRRETKAFSDLVTQTALAVATSVADGYGRPEAAEQRDCYRRSRRFLAELETQLAVARHAELLSPAALAQVTLRVGGVSRLLGGYLAFIDRQIAAEAAVVGAAAGPAVAVERAEGAEGSVASRDAPIEGGSEATAIRSPAPPSPPAVPRSTS